MKSNPVLVALGETADTGGDDSLSRRLILGWYVSGKLGGGAAACRSSMRREGTSELGGGGAIEE